MPDIALYDGVYFEFGAGGDRVKGITVIPGRVTNGVKIWLPDGEAVSPKDLLPKCLDAHAMKYERDFDDGAGNVFVVAQEPVQIQISKGQVATVSIFSWEPSGSSPLSVEVRGKKIAVPIMRAELEALLGKPDSFCRRTAPEEEYRKWLEGQ
jgi:hypothetical protein